MGPSSYDVWNAPVTPRLTQSSPTPPVLNSIVLSPFGREVRTDIRIKVSHRL